MKKELALLQEATAKALEDYKKWLQEDLLPRSEWRFPDRRREVPQETPLLPRVRFVDGRNHEAREAPISRPRKPRSTRPRFHFIRRSSRRRTPQPWPTRKRSRPRCSTSWRSSVRTDETIVAYAKKTLASATEFTKAKGARHRFRSTTRHHRDAGIQARAGRRVLRLPGTAGERGRNVLRHLSDTGRLVEGAEGIVLSRV